MVFPIRNRKQARRRNVLVSFATMIVGAGARAAKTDMLTSDGQRDSPQATMSHYAHMRSSGTGRPSLWYGKSVYYGQLGDEPPAPILGAEQLDLVTVDYDGANRLAEVTDKVMYFTDLETNEILGTWRNPFTGEMLDLIRPKITTSSLIESNKIHAEERSSYVAIDRTGTLHSPVLQGNMLTIALEQFATFNATALQSEANHRSNQRWWSGIWSSFSSNLSDLTGPDGKFIACSGQTFASAPWYSWLRMGTRPGTSSMRSFVTKYEHIGDLPPSFVAWAERNHPGFLARL